jgi:Protein of unknown function with PCYCGC motif
MHGPLARLFCLALLCGMATLLAANGKAPTYNRTQDTTEKLAYHDHFPTEPLPRTLDPAQFQDNRGAFVAYALAAQVGPTLYQVPCYCGCDKAQGHQSLLDCFTDKHGVFCHICQQEVLFCFLQHKKGKSPAQIREAMAEGAAMKLNLKRSVDHYYAQVRKSQK